MECHGKIPLSSAILANIVQSQTTQPVMNILNHLTDNSIPQYYVAIICDKFYLPFVVNELRMIIPARNIFHKKLLT